MSFLFNLSESVARKNTQMVKDKAPSTLAQSRHSAKGSQPPVGGEISGVTNSERIYIGEVRSIRCLSLEAPCSSLQQEQ